jgi:hypothetical protein
VASESEMPTAFFFLRSYVGWLDSDLLERHEVSWATHPSLCVSTVEKGRSDGSRTGEQGLCGWCSVKWRPELLRCGKSADSVVDADLGACQQYFGHHLYMKKQLLQYIYILEDIKMHRLYESIQQVPLIIRNDL